MEGRCTLQVEVSGNSSNLVLDITKRFELPKCAVVDCFQWESYIASLCPAVIFNY